MNEIINNTPDTMEAVAKTVANSDGQMKFAAAGFGIGVATGIGIAKIFKVAKRKILTSMEEKGKVKKRYITVNADDIDEEAEE